MTEKTKKCNCFAVAFVAGRPCICLVEVLHLTCKSNARVYTVKPNVAIEDVLKQLKPFKKYPYCPKCGKKIDFNIVEKNIQKLFEVA